MMITRLRASPRHGGAMSFRAFVADPPRGRPFGGGGVYRNREFARQEYLIDLKIFMDHFPNLFIQFLSCEVMEISDGYPPQGLSEARRAMSIRLLLPIRRGGVPSGAAAFIVIENLGDRNTLLI